MGSGEEEEGEEAQEDSSPIELDWSVLTGGLLVPNIINQPHTKPFTDVNNDQSRIRLGALFQ